MRFSGFVLLVLILQMRCFSQSEDVLYIDASEIRTGVSPSSAAAQPTEVPQGDGPVFVITARDSAHSQLRTLYYYCPGLVSGFEKMRSLPQLRIASDPEFKEFNAALDEALKAREEYLEQSMDFGSESIFLQRRFVDRVLATESSNDRALSDIFAEVVPPARLPQFISALGPGFENGLLTSQLFREYASVSKKDFDSRLVLHRGFLEWAVNSAGAKDADFKVGKSKLGALYENLSVEEFLDLKYLLGKSPRGETIEEHLSRIRDIEMDLACYVNAIDRERKNKK